MNWIRKLLRALAEPGVANVTSTEASESERLIESPSSTTNDATSAAADAMSHQIERLIGELSSHSDPDKQIDAIHELCGLADARAVEALVSVLSKDRFPFRSAHVRAAAAAALGARGDARAVTPLLNVLKKYSDAGVTGRAAAKALGRLGHRRAVDALIDALKDPSLTGSAAEALGMLGDQRAVIPLVEVLRGKNDVYDAMRALVCFGPEHALEPLISVLREPSAETRARAASIMSELPDPRAVDPLIRLLDDNDYTVRSEAAKALVAQGSEKAVQPLIDTLMDRGDPSVARAIGKLRNFRAVAPLLAKLSSSNAATWEGNILRSEIAAALGEIGDTRAVEPLIEVLGDSILDVRKSVTKALENLLSVVETCDSDLRMRAVDALRAFGDDASAQALLDRLGVNRSETERIWATRKHADLTRLMRNSLGMDMLPVPSTGVLFGKYVVTNGEYRKFRPLHNSNLPGYMEDWFENDPKINGDHNPVVNVNIQDVREFCRWLTVVERQVGLIGMHQRYRLPLDWEWSVAVGLDEPRHSSVEDKSQGYVPVYPWGADLPPPPNAGHLPKLPSKPLVSPLAEDDSAQEVAFKTTAPVGSYRAGLFGLYDMCGNVLQFCEDCFTSSNEVLRGSSWRSEIDVWLASQKRWKLETQTACYPNIGVRLVLAGE